MKNILVFFGGQSVEHDVSILTGVMATNLIDKDKFNAIPIYVSRDGVWYTGKNLLDLDEYKKLNLKNLTKVVLLPGQNILYSLKGNRLKNILEISVALNCMHGERGEDGCLAGLLNLCKIPLASPDIMPSSVCMDKTFTKIALKGLNIKTLKSITVFNADEIEEVKRQFAYPLIVKPNKSGSSIGVNIAKDDSELYSSINYALRFGDCVIIEPCLENFIEINCSAYMDSTGEIIVSECERPVGRTKLLSFNDKYEGGKRIFPADIDNKYSKLIKKTTKLIYQKFSFSGVIRIDYFITENKVLVNEINTVPGSLAYYLFGDTLTGFTKMLNQIIDNALKNYAKSLTTQKTFKTSILSFGGAKGVKHLKKLK